MSDTKGNRNSIPVSVLIADSRNKLNEIVNHPLLPSSIVELILKEAWQTSAIKAQKQLVSDYEKVQGTNCGRYGKFFKRRITMAYNYQPYRVSGSVTNYKNKQDTATRNYNNYANTNYSAGAGGLGNEVKTAQDRLNALYRNNNLSQQFKYSKQSDYDKALSAISNRKAFQYDLSDDMLFQQAKEQYQQMGKTAMADTIGQASAMTGGYGNSYATTAGAQAYNNYLQELNNSIGDYYSMALSTYNNETDRLNSIYNAYAADRSTEGSEWTNNWNVYNQLYSQYYNQYSDMLNKDMSAWEQKGNNLYNAANLATSQYSTASSNDINVWNSQEQLRAEQASQIETERANRAEEAYRNASLQETIRANKASEQYNNAALAETIPCE